MIQVIFASLKLLWWILELLRHFQCTANPLNPPYQGDFGTFAKVGVIGKCLLIFLIHYSFTLTILDLHAACLFLYPLEHRINFQ